MRPWRLEIQPFHGTLARTFESRSARFGPEVGFGIMETATFRADDLEYQPVLHIGMRVERSKGRVIPSGHALLGYGATLDCDASDCWPEPFGAAAFGLTRVGDRFSFGTRVQLGRQRGETLFAWSPLILGIGFGRRAGS